MKNKNKKILMGVGSLLFGLSQNAIAQDPRNNNLQVSAKITPGCFLTAENISFGILMTPIQDQVAQGNLNVHCSKGASLKINLEYLSNGTIGTVASVKVSSVVQGPHHIAGNTYFLYNNGKRITTNTSYDIWCYSGLGVAFGSDNIRQAYGVTASSWTTDTKGLCSGNNIVSSKVVSKSIATGTATKAGNLIGNSAGEKIVYSVVHPTDASKIWNIDNAYSFSGTGVEQNVLMKASIKRSDNNTYRMTPDTYTDTINVVLTY